VQIQLTELYRWSEIPNYGARSWYAWSRSFFLKTKINSSDYCVFMQVSVSSVSIGTDDINDCTSDVVVMMTMTITVTIVSRSGYGWDCNYMFITLWPHSLSRYSSEGAEFESRSGRRQSRVGFQVSIAMIMKITVLWVVIRCVDCREADVSEEHIASIFRTEEESCWRQLPPNCSSFCLVHSVTLKMEAVC
jgi:hypothetical protein